MVQVQELKEMRGETWRNDMLWPDANSGCRFMVGAPRIFTFNGILLHKQ